ncbi:hypothetical protein THF1C08_280092 [Vibrio jasicida]|uniref:Uncharacterized protein n=1 Tax=Vibrio jasicida TaxID=766224 RepID=A0AAU9QPH7_9VIBR|nr:hypothetical protein THF1C08_280092 [Vibrio jasicida]CAH1594000.1 hypothetical protein THF1A12_270092 [Vibrio jasicida]
MCIGNLLFSENKPFSLGLLTLCRKKHFSTTHTKIKFLLQSCELLEIERFFKIELSSNGVFIFESVSENIPTSPPTLLI